MVANLNHHTHRLGNFLLLSLTFCFFSLALVSSLEVQSRFSSNRRNFLQEHGGRQAALVGLGIGSSLWKPENALANEEEETQSSNGVPMRYRTGAAAGVGSATFNPVSIGSWAAVSARLQTKLARDRILARELSPLQQPIWDGAQELYYAPFLFGSWKVEATLQRKVFPYGVEYLPSRSLLEGSPRNREEAVGNTCEYEVHYFSTLANTLANQATVNLGLGVPQSKIIQDRAFNAISISTAYQQLTPIQQVKWDYRESPGRLLLDMGTGLLAADMRPLGQRRAEVYIIARTFDDPGDGVRYCTAERSRTVTLATRDVLVSDVETITEFEKISDDRVSATSRIAVYLTPNPNSREGILWQQTGGKAIAFFDYELTMKRLKEDFFSPDGSMVQRACVLTPKDVVQCA